MQAWKLPTRISRTVSAIANAAQLVYTKHGGGCDNMLTPRIVEAKPQSDFSLRLTYENGDIRGSWFCELADYDYFKRVAVNVGIR